MNHRKYGLDICCSCRKLAPIIAMRFTAFGPICDDCFKKKYFKA